jgi:hypothetical protein
MRTKLVVGDIIESKLQPILKLTININQERNKSKGSKTFVLSTTSLVTEIF